MDREVESGWRCLVCTQACCSQGRGTCRRGNDCLAGRSFYSQFLETEGSPRRATQGWSGGRGSEGEWGQEPACGFRGKGRQSGQAGLGLAGLNCFRRLWGKELSLVG